MNTEFIWHRVPFMRLLLPFLGGIIFQIYLQTDIHGLVPVVLLLFAGLLAFTFIRKAALSYRYRFMFGALLTLFLFSSGILIVTVKTDSRNETQFSKLNDKEGWYAVRLHEPYLEKDRSLKVVMDVVGVEKDGEWKPSTGKAMFYIQKDSVSGLLRYGDCLLVHTSFAEIPSPKNPSEFNYKQYLYFHNVYEQAYVRAGEWKSLGVNEGSWVLRWSYGLRDELLDIFKRSGLKGDEYAVAAALVLGYEDKLDADIISAYASTGALHVLSVSGLHVGIIYFVFNFFFSFLDKRKRGHITKTFLLLFIIWFYATLTGLSPSVLRSAAMFTFIIIAKGFKLNSDIFNTLAVSCFVLLLYDPYLVMEVGFQLSFLAVFGIIFLQPRLYDLWQPKTRLMDWIWALTTVSVAAQLVTFPLGLLYFHQFPNLFLFSNLVVIPVSTVVLYFGILLFFVWKVAGVGWLAAKGLIISVWLLNSSVKFMERIPYAIIQGISISVLETWIIYFTLAFLTAFLFNRRRQYLVLCLCSIVLVLVIQVQQNFVESHQKRLVVYYAPHATAIDLIDGKQNTFIADTAFMHNSSRMLFHVRHNWWDSGADVQQLVGRTEDHSGPAVLKAGPFVQFYSERILVADSSFKLPRHVDAKVKVNLLLLSGNIRLRLKDLLQAVEPGLVVFDNSSPPGRIARWKKECGELRLSSYDVNEKGALVLEL
jgi:competence protein ComEC